MLKRIFTLLILIAFCSTSSAIAVDPKAANLTKNDVFDNNYQSTSTAHSVSNSLSTIEKMYNGKDSAISGNILRQVGYEQFSSSTGVGNSTTGKYDSSYKLSIGEKINILSYGDSVDVISLSGSNLVSPMTSTEVGSNGSLFVQGIGLVKAEGRTLGEVENEINAMAKRKYTNMQVKLQVASGSGFSVFIYGEVNKPGKVYISNNSSILDALGAAGGVKKTGTLRKIKYNNKHVDLYNALFLGNDNGIIVKANDKIFVEKIGKTAALKNGVTNPGIYEYKDGETLKDIVKYAGDTLVTTEQGEVTVVSFDKNIKQKIAKNLMWDVAQNYKLNNGDSFEFKELYNGVENLVTIQGNIKHPATYAYKPNMRLSDILKSEDELLEETFIYQAVIRRVSGKNNEVETIPVFLKEFFNGMNDPILQPRDVITIYRNTNSEFVDMYGCINLPKHIPYITNMSLKDAMTDVQFMESEVKNMYNVQFDTEKKGNDVKLAVSTENTNKLIPTENVAVEITDKSGNTKIYYMYDIMVNSDQIKSVKLNANDKIFFRTLRPNEVIKSIKISGFVKKPGVYSFIKGQKLTDVIIMAGGLDENADLRGIVFRRANLKEKQVNIARKNNERDIKLLEGRIAAGYKQTEVDTNTKLGMIEQLKQEQDEFVKKYDGQIALNIKNNDLKKVSKIDNVVMQDGDDIYIPRMTDYVAVVGEVYNEQSFMHTHGATVKKYIKQVGGYTPNANRFRLYKVGVNGRAQKVRMRTKVAAGDTIVVPRRIAGNDWITPICQTLQGLASAFIMAFAINKW